jgi:hypothetical protein
LQPIIINGQAKPSQHKQSKDNTRQAKRRLKDKQKEYIEDEKRQDKTRQDKT